MSEGEPLLLELKIAIANIFNKQCQCRNSDYWADDTIGN